MSEKNPKKSDRVFVRLDPRKMDIPAMYRAMKAVQEEADRQKALRDKEAGSPGKAPK